MLESSANATAGASSSGSPWGAVASAGGDIISSLISYNSARKANKMNLQLARENRKWQERMSSTAHQREVVDLRKAGLNPILSAMGGNGASTPSGSTPTMVSEMPDTKGTVSSAIRLHNEMKQLKAITSKISNEARISDTQANFAEQQQEAELELKNKQRELVMEQILTERTNQSLNSANASYKNAESLNLPFQQLLLKAQADNYKGHSSKMAKEIQEIVQNMAINAPLAGFSKNHPNLKLLGGAIGGMSPILTGLLGGLIGANKPHYTPPNWVRR